MNPKISDEHITSREGVNATQSFFETNSCVFQEIAQQNDFGKDAYVDIGTNGYVTFLCAALQIKSGKSYKTTKGDYAIPIDTHAENWRRSTIPVFGIVYDPDDGLLRWRDLTGFLRANPDDNSGNIPVDRNAILTAEILHSTFKATLHGYAVGGFDVVVPKLLSLGSLQTDAVVDAWALGRHDYRYLVILRRLILELNPPSIREAIALLSRLGDHPDIFWTKEIWLPRDLKDKVLPSFHWSPDEIVHMLMAIDHEDYGRGTLGQCLDVLLYEDPDILPKLHSAVGLLLSKDGTQAVRAATLALTHSKDQRSEVALLSRDYPNLLTNEWFREIYASVHEFGYLSLY